MELFAAGFNAWEQLTFDPCLDGETQAERGHSREEEPHDLNAFAKVLAGGLIERPVARLSYTIVRRDGRLCAAGLGPQSEEELRFLYSSAETASGELLSIRGSTNPSDNSNVLLKYTSLAAWKSRSSPQSWPCSPPAKQVAAFDAGFVILCEDGSVATFGDPRFEGCLGRDITAEQPAAAPGPVPDLHDINSNDPVKHITAGGSSIAALTRTSGSVYVWGTPSPGSSYRRRQAFRGELLGGGAPNYTEVDGDKDVADVALGDSHAIALAADGGVYVIGENNNGQLGLGRGFGERAEDWTKVPFEIAAGFHVTGVAAGPKASFILTSKVG